MHHYQDRTKWHVVLVPSERGDSEEPGHPTWTAICIDYGYTGWGKTISDAIRVMIADARISHKVMKQNKLDPTIKWVNGWQRVGQGWEPPPRDAGWTGMFNQAIRCRSIFGIGDLRLSERNEGEMQWLKQMESY